MLQPQRHPVSVQQKKLYFAEYAAFNDIYLYHVLIRIKLVVCTHKTVHTF